jgi:hypothetical protein
MDKEEKKVEETKPSVQEPVKQESVKQEPVKATEEIKPKKKVSGCLIAFLIFLAIIIGLTLFVYFRIKSLATSLGKQQDLGITYSQADFGTLLEKLNLTEDFTPIAQDTDSVAIDTTILSKEASVAVSELTKLSEEVTVINPQIRFGNDDVVEISAILNIQERPVAIYIEATIEKASSNSITGEIIEAKVGNFRIPSIAMNLIQKNLFTMLNDSLFSLGDNLQIETLQITNAGLKLKGIVPVN